jgi:hypothetical protein
MLYTLPLRLCEFEIPETMFADPCELVNVLFKLDESSQVVVGRVPTGRYITGKGAPMKPGWCVTLKKGVPLWKEESR